jgi:hypothetical protein
MTRSGAAAAAALAEAAGEALDEAGATPVD